MLIKASIQIKKNSVTHFLFKGLLRRAEKGMFGLLMIYKRKEIYESDLLFLLCFFANRKFLRNLGSI